MAAEVASEAPQLEAAGLSNEPVEPLDAPAPHAVFETRLPDGGAIFVRRHGNPAGPRIVLTHGNGFSADAYAPFWSHLTADFDVFVYDLRGHGWNPVGDRRAHNLPRFVDDNRRVARDVDRLFGSKPRFGIFHSLSAAVALVQATGSRAEYGGLVLFDPPICPPGGLPESVQGVAAKLAAAASERRDRFDSPEAFAESLAGGRAFRNVHRAVIDVFARATLRPAGDGDGYVLRCPREHEAQVYAYYFVWAMAIDLERITCPVKVIGSDPTVPYSFMPSMDLGAITAIDYDFLPGTTHLLVLEQPDRCARLAAECIGRMSGSQRVRPPSAGAAVRYPMNRQG